MADKLQSKLSQRSFVQIGAGDGHTVIDKNTPLKLLHYFDGRFLRAPDLKMEQLGLLNQVYLANRAGGAGIVHGYDTVQAGNDSLSIGPGLGFDFDGRALYLTHEVEVGVSALIEASRSTPVGAITGRVDTLSGSIEATEFDDCVLPVAPSTPSTVNDDDLYLVVVCYTEAFCGEEDVYGKLCSEACVSSKDKSFIVQGVQIKAIPLNLTVGLKQSKFPLSEKHWRSRVACAYYEQERRKTASHISKEGLSSNIWCLGADSKDGNCIPIAVIGRSGGSIAFLDAWASRRERMETPPRHYWALRMAMRPWNIFLAQILQFQCQLRACFAAPTGQPCKRLIDFDPCIDERKIAGKAAEDMLSLVKYYEAVAGKFTELESLEAAPLLRGNAFFADGIATVKESYKKLVDIARVVLPNRLLINCGIVELPSAGYLPVNESTTVSVNEQVRRQLGEGVDLCFCVVRPDYIPHALIEAQHMERICLLSGIDDPAQKPDVEVLVPNGHIEDAQEQAAGLGYETTLSVDTRVFALGWPARLKVNFTAADILNAGAERTRNSIEVAGAGRGDRAETDGFVFYFGGRTGEAGSTASLASGNLQSALRLLGDTPEASPTEFTGPAADFRLASGLRLNTLNVAKNLALNLANRITADAAMWVSLKIDRDPFALARGDSTDVKAKITTVMSQTVSGATVVSIEERTVNGTLVIEQTVPQGAGGKIKAGLGGEGIWTSTRITADAKEVRSEPVTLNETVVISNTGPGVATPALKVSIFNPSFFAGLDNVQLVFERLWTTAEKSIIKGALRYQLPSYRTGSEAAAGLRINTNVSELSSLSKTDQTRELVLFSGTMVEDGRVLQPGNSWHSASTQSLSQIGQALESKTFSDQAVKLLFPPPVPAAQELRLFARECWVLFRRKREKVCEQVRAPALVKPRLYRVYHVNLNPQIDIPTLIEDLKADSNTINRFGARPVTLVEFKPGIATVSTSQGDIRDDWQAAVRVDAQVHIGIIASQGDVENEGPVLAETRLDGVTDIIKPVSDPAENLALFGVAEIPSTLAAGEVDGVIVYFTKAVATICHRVYRLATREFDVFREELAGYASEPGSVNLDTFMARRQGQLLSTSPRFAEGTTTYFGEDEAGRVEAAWRLADNGPVSRGVVLVSAESDISPSVAQQQTSALIAAVGSTAEPVDIIEQQLPAQLLTPCPNASVLVAETICHEVYLYAPRVENADESLKEIVNFIQENGLTLEMITAINAGFTAALAPSPWRRLSMVDFFKDTDDFEPASREGYITVWNEILGDAAPSDIKAHLIAVAENGAAAAEVAMAEQQAQAIGTVMGIATQGRTGVVNGGEGSLPSLCRAITILFVPTVFTPAAAVPASEEVPGVIINPDDPGFIEFTAQPVTRRLYVVPSATLALAEQPAGTPPAETTTLEEVETILAGGIRLDENLEIIRDEKFEAAIARLGKANKIRTIEVVSLAEPGENETDERAEKLLTVLREVGVARADAKVNIRKATGAEKVEIVRRGFELDRGITFK